MRFALVARGVVCLALATATLGAHAEKVLRYAIRASETGFDPVMVTDLYSRYLTGNIFDAPLRYKWMSNDQIEPNTLESMPEHSADYTTYTYHLKKGIYFADDPVFKGKRRELTAMDYVYSFKRIFDPKLNSQYYGQLEVYHFAGLEKLRQAAIKSGHFDYDTPIDDIKTLDRYTWQIHLAAPSPRFNEDNYVDSSSFGAVAREVIEAYGNGMEHPVGTGPYMLSEWVRSSKITLVRNPNYRTDLYDATPTDDAADLKAFVATHKGKQMPFVDRVVVSVIEESQPRWLSFINGEDDYLDTVPFELGSLAFPNNHLAPNLKQKNLQFQHTQSMRQYVTIFNMQDPIVGGYTPEKVALRRAIGLGLNVPAMIRTLFAYQATPAESFLLPKQTGYDPNLRAEMGEYDLARANAILDTFGYLPRHGGKWRDLPDGKPFTIIFSTTATQFYRQIDEIVKKSFDDLGIRMETRPGTFPEQLKAAEAGDYTMWFLGLSSTQADPSDGLQNFYGPAKGGTNFTFFQLKEYDDLYRQQDALPDGPQRLAIILKERDLLNAYMPMKFTLVPDLIFLWYPWLQGYRYDPMLNDWWRYVDIDEAQQKPYLHEAS